MVRSEPIKILYFLSNRASYYRSYVLLDLMKTNLEIDLTIMLTSSLVTNEFKEVKNEIKEKFPKVVELPMRLYDGSLLSMATCSFDLGIAISSYLNNNTPTLAVCFADRFELLPFSMACSYLNIPLAQIQAGEDSGNIDNKVRNAVSALADMHFVSNAQAHAKLKIAGCKKVFNTGCPSLDLIKRHRIERSSKKDYDLTGEKYLICIFHPHTNELEDIEWQSKAVFDAVSEFVNENKDDKYKCYYFESNNDPGFHSIKKQLTENKNIEPITNLTGVKFLRLLAGAHAIVGNSSSGLREAGFLGVPAVNIGDRQRNRFKSGNVFDCNFNKIKETIYEAVEYNPKPSTLYGSGTSSFHIIGRILEWHRKKLKNNKSSSQEPQTDIS